MWKVCISVDEANEISNALKSFLNSQAANDAMKDQAATIKAMLDDKIQVVECENKLVQDYIDSMKDEKDNQCRRAV